MWVGIVQYHGTNWKDHPHSQFYLFIDSINTEYLSYMGLIQDNKKKTLLNIFPRWNLPDEKWWRQKKLNITDFSFFGCQTNKTKWSFIEFSSISAKFHGKKMLKNLALKKKSFAIMKRFCITKTRMTFKCWCCYSCWAQASHRENHSVPSHSFAVFLLVLVMMENKKLQKNVRDFYRSHSSDCGCRSRALWEKGIIYVDKKPFIH